MTTYIIRRGEVRGAGEYISGHEHESHTVPEQGAAWRFKTRASAMDYVGIWLTPGWRVVRLLPAGTMRARRKATARELRAMAARLLKAHRATAQEDWHDVTVAAELEARAAELEDT